MTTSTTDAEAIARIIDPNAFRGAFRSTQPSLSKDLARAKATAILSYLASRREAQEPVAWLRDVDGTGSLHPASKGDPGAFPVYTAPPAPAGEVERLVKPIIDRLEWNGRLQQWVVRPDLPAGTINAVRVALNGGRSDG